MPTIAQQIYDHAVSIGHYLKVGETWGKSATVPVGAAGCLSKDYEIFVHDNRYYARWFMAWRASVWRDLVATPVSQSFMAIAQRPEGFPVPDSVDSDLLDRLDAYDEYGRPDAGRVLSALAHPEHSVLTQLRRLRRFAITGLNLSTARRVPPIDQTIKDDDVEFLLPAFAACSHSAGHQEVCSAGPLLWASWRLGQPLGEVLRRIRLLTPGGWSPPIPELGDLSTHTCTYDEATFLSRNFSNSDHQWVEAELGPAHLVRAGDELGRSINEVLALCDELSPLGIPVAGRGAYPDDLDLMETLALRSVHAPGQPLRPLDLILIAGRAGTSVGAVYDGLARLERLGFLVRPAITGPKEFPPTRQVLHFIDRRLRSYYSRAASAFIFTDTPWIDVMSTVLSDMTTEAEQQIAFSLSSFLAPTEAVTWKDLIHVAHGTEKTLARTAEAFQEVYPDVRIPPVPEEFAELKVPWTVASALGTYRIRGERQLSPATIIISMLYSRQPLGDFLGLLDRFRPLGIPLPPFDESIRAGLNQVKLDEYDLDMLTVYDELGEDTYLRTVNSLALVQIAGRLGWTLVEAHQRFARLVPIGLILEYPQADLPDEIVYWYDLLALTTYFDGQEPVISGRIDQAYLERAAEEIFDVPPDQIPEKAALLRERLKIYAPLFEFELDTPEEDPVG